MLARVESISKQTKLLVDASQTWHQPAQEPSDKLSPAGAVASYALHVENDAAAIGSSIALLRHQYRRKKEEERQLKIMSDPKLHVPSRRTKIIAQVRHNT